MFEYRVDIRTIVILALILLAVISVIAGPPTAIVAARNASTHMYIRIMGGETQ